MGMKVNRQYYDPEKDGFYGAFYECPSGSDKAMILMLGDAIDQRREARKAMLDAYGEALTRMYSLDDGIFEVLYPEDITAVVYSFSSEPEVISF